MVKVQCLLCSAIIWNIAFMLYLDWYCRHHLAPTHPIFHVDICNAFSIASASPCRLETDELESPPFDIDIVWLWDGDSIDLRYSLRSVCLFLPWYHRIYIVVPPAVLTAIPEWLNTSYVENGRITFVPQTYFFLKFNLTNSLKFGSRNSEQLESMIHHIDGLSDLFVYFNDDMFIGRPTAWDFFFSYNAKLDKYVTNIHRKYADLYSNILFFKNGAYNCPYKHAEINRLLKADKLPKGRVNRYIEHHPRAYIKSELLLFEAMYAEFFRIVRSHNGHRWNSCNDGRRYFEESIWFYMLRYKLDDTHDEFQPFHANILNTTRIASSSHGSYGEQARLRLIYHSWIRNQRSNRYLYLFYLTLREVIGLRPYTFTIQEDWISHSEDQLFGKYVLMQFYIEYFSSRRCGLCKLENANETLYNEIEQKYKAELFDMSEHQLTRLQRILTLGKQRETHLKYGRPHKSSHTASIHLITLL